MRSHLEIAGSSDFENSGWQLLVLKTPRVTSNTFWRNGDPPILFAFDGDIDRRLALAMIAFLDSVDAKQALCGTGVLSADLGPFDTCGFIGGHDRKLLRGITEDDTLVHAIPMYSYELREDGSLPPLEQFRRWTNIFDCQREPQPWFQFRMSGGRSGLNVQKWGTEKVSTLHGFITMLSQETTSWIEVRNRWGAVLRLPDTAGWNNAKDKVSRHVRHAQPVIPPDAAR